MTKYVAANALHQVAENRPFGELFGDDEAEAGAADFVRAVMQREVFTTKRTPKSKNG